MLFQRNNFSDCIPNDEYRSVSLSCFNTQPMCSSPDSNHPLDKLPKTAILFQEACPLSV